MRKARRTLGALPAIALALTALAPADLAAQADDALSVEAIVAGVQGFYDAVESYHADFEQTYTNIALAEDQIANGHVYIRKPGLMRWDYLAPQVKYLTTNGEVLWIYEPEFSQAARLDLNHSDLPIAVRFLYGEGDLDADFTITQRECRREGVYCLNLVPRVSEGQYQSLAFVIDSETFSVVETTVIDPIGNRNHFAFTNASTTDELPAENFEFTPPEGTRIITP